MANCINCGVQIPDNYKLCNKCRNELTQNHYEAPPPAQNDAGISMLLPVGRSPLAIIAGYLGLFSLLLFIGIIAGNVLCLLPWAPFISISIIGIIGIIAIIAIIIGTIAIIDLKKHPEKRGLGRAIFGIIMSVIVITSLFWLFIFINLVE